MSSSEREALAADEQLNGRYTVVRALGSGSFGETFEASDAQRGQRVAIKRLELRKVGDWRAVELFEREARVLRSLEHLAIPRYIDFFHSEADGHLHLVQELVEGTTLAASISAGARFSEDEVIDIASQILNVLEYLQDLRPPVFHRDLKPENLIRRSDGRIFVLDFGSVGGALRSAGSLAGSVAGTFGYMAPEQLHGRAEPATDLYGLGATLLHLVTHQHPGDFPQKRLRIDLDDVYTGSPEFRRWLQRLLEPAPEDRFHSARAALQALKEPPMELEPKPRPRPKLAKYPKSPHATRIRMTRTNSSLELDIPGTFSLANSALAIPFVVFALMYAGLPSKTQASSAPPLFFLVVFGLIASFQLFRVVRDTFGKTRLSFDESGFELSLRLFGMSVTKRGRTSRIDHVEVKAAHSALRGTRGAPDRFVVLHEGAIEHRFGRHLSDAEREWLADVISTFMRNRHRQLKEQQRGEAPLLPEKP